MRIEIFFGAQWFLGIVRITGKTVFLGLGLVAFSVSNLLALCGPLCAIVQHCAFAESTDDPWWVEVEIFLFHLWFFGIVHQVCSVVPGHDVAWVNAVPQQHATFEHFAQTGAAVHPALFKPLLPLMKKSIQLMKTRSQMLRRR